MLFRSRDRKTNEYQITIEAKDLTNNLDDAPSSLLKEVIGCLNKDNADNGYCRKAFKITEDEFTNYMKTKEGREYLEGFHTAKGVSIGSYEELVDDPFEEWKKAERAKYEKYYHACITGKNESGKKLRPGQEVEEIYPIDIWREQKRMGGYDPILPGARPPGYAKKKVKDLPTAVPKILSLGIFLAVIIGVVSWWGVDLFVLATATGGLAIGIGFALQETMQNWFAYIMIRKDKIFVEGDRIKLDTGYDGYVHKISSRVTYVRHALNESIAVIPTRQLVNSQIINFSKELKLVPAVDRKSTRLNSSHMSESRMPSSA